MNKINHEVSNPYRWFFLLGIVFLLFGALVWIPLIWTSDFYPILIHRYAMLNGFTACFIAGFLMTAVPRFSGAPYARISDISLFTLVTLFGFVGSFWGNERLVSFFSAIQAMSILAFLFSRISKRKQNPPYSFLFIFVGLILWMVSALHFGLTGSETLKSLHYEGAIAAIILGVGSRLIPGILGHSEIVQQQRSAYEKPVAIIKTVPLTFLLLIFGFIASYFMDDFSKILRAAIVGLVAVKYWKLYKKPKEQTALTWSIWCSSWLIVTGFSARAIMSEGDIHLTHVFFIGGIVLLSLMVATRVIQSHGPKDKKLENAGVIYWVLSLTILAMLTRVSAYYLPELYLSHLAYGAMILIIAVVLWSVKYLVHMRIENKE
jgi:uncharacterized protein involved in response to NO